MFLIRLFLLICLVPAAMAKEAPSVVVSVKPLHSVVASLMQGVAEPVLLLDGSQSPHHFQLSPSQVRDLSGADLVIWVGESLELPLRKVLAANVSANRVVELLESAEQADAKHHHEEHHQHHHDVDPHIWLSFKLVRQAVSDVTARLIAIDSQNEWIYRKNADLFLLKLELLKVELQTLLGPVRETPYMVFHDAYGYFESEYGLNNVGIVTPSPERQPGAKHLHELKQTITSTKAVCIFTEPQFKPDLVRTLIEGTQVRSGVLDPLGASIETGPNAYFQLVEAMAASLVNCLKGSADR